MIQVAPGFYRGPKVDIDLVVDECSVVINLETDVWEILTGKGNDELIECIYDGIHFYDFALSNFIPPTPYLTQEIINLITASEGVYLHCRHGKERTGFIVAAYRMIVQGWTFDTAYAEWKAMGCRWPWYVLWKQALRRCA